MIYVLCALSVCALLGIAAYFLSEYKHERTKNALLWWLISSGLVCLVWFYVAVPYSIFQSDTCERVAEGYGLDNYDWSIRNGCRVYLPGGQLVPENRIRITTDGQIIVNDD